MAYYYFALTNVDAESLLKEEISLRYPELRISYSRPGFLTFKGENLISFNPLFARVSGRTIGKFREKELLYSKAWVWARNDKLEIPSKLKEVSDKTLYKAGEEVTLIMMVGPDEFWVGTYKLGGHHFQTPGEVSSILPREDVPSRAYYKIAEAFEAFDLPFDNHERVLELGSAPGGASLFLLEQDMKVLGVDPADMDPRILKNNNFKHLRRPFETLTENDLRDIDWIVSDINLPPTVVLKEVYRMLKFIEPRGVVLTLKMNELKHLEVVATVREKFKNLGFQKVELKYLPAHKKEIALIALHS